MNKEERFTKGGWAKYPTLFVFDNKIERELNSMECINILNELNDENDELKKILGAILFEVKKDISNTNQTGEIRVFINPNSFELISEVLKKYGALKGWYE